MNLRIDPLTPETDSESREFGRGYLLVLVALTVLILSWIIFGEQGREAKGQFRGSTSEEFQGLTLLPQVVAGGITIQKGLEAYSGRMPSTLPTALRTAMLASTLLAFVIFPTVYLFGWRERRLSRLSSYRGHTLRISSIVYGICAVPTLFVAIVLVPITIAQERVRHSVRQGQAVQSAKDAMIMSINAIDVDLQQYRILPRGQGGGEGTYLGYSLPSNLAQTPEAAFTVTAETDKATIKGRSKVFLNATIAVSVDEHWAHPPWVYEGEFQ